LKDKKKSISQGRLTLTFRQVRQGSVNGEKEEEEGAGNERKALRGAVITNCGGRRGWKRKVVYREQISTINGETGKKKRMGKK